MQIWPHSRMDWKKEIKRRGCVVLTHPLLFRIAPPTLGKEFIGIVSLFVHFVKRLIFI